VNSNDSKQKQSISQRNIDSQKRNKRDGNHHDTSEQVTKERSVTPVKSRMLRGRSESPYRRKEKKKSSEQISKEKSKPSKSKRSSTEKKRHSSTSPSRHGSSMKDRRSRGRSKSPSKKKSKEDRRKQKDSLEPPQSTSQTSSTESKRESSKPPKKSKPDKDTKSASKSRRNRDPERQNSQVFESAGEKEKMTKIIQSRDTLERRNSEKVGSSKMVAITKEQLMKDMAKIGSAAGRGRDVSTRARHDLRHKPVNVSSLRPFDLKDLKVTPLKKDGKKK